MKHITPSVLTLLAVASQCAAGDQIANSSKPNIVVILADDLGYGDVQCLNPKRGKIPTPNLDKLAAQGMIFTDAHSSSSVCTPSRYSILTGRYNWRSSLQRGVLGGMSSPLIPPNRLTVAGLLKQQGYATACIGKWHLGMQMPSPHTKGTIKNGPVTRGFDYYFGISASLDMPPYAFIENDRFTEAPTATKELLKGRGGAAAPSFESVDVLPTLTQKSVAWIGQHKTQPFFLYMALNSPHTPLAPNKEWKGKSGLGDYADFVLETDWAVGEVMKAVDGAGLTSNTLVIVTSDNGCAPYVGTSSFDDPALSALKNGAVSALEAKGHFPSAQFRGYKSDSWDGGHRVPFIVRWPAVIKPGATCAQLVCQMDLLATCAEIHGATLPDNAGEDSFSLLPLLKGGSQPTLTRGERSRTSSVEGPVRETLVHHSCNGRFSIREGKWKLILCPGSGGWGAPPKVAKGEKLPEFQLYDISVDEGEQTNLQAEHPEIVKCLTEKLEDIVADGRSTPLRQSWFDDAHHGSGLAGAPQKNDVPVDIFKKGK